MNEKKLGVSEYTGLFFNEEFIDSYHKKLEGSGFDDSMDRIRVINHEILADENDVIFNRLDGDKLKELRLEKLRKLLNQNHSVKGCLIGRNLKEECVLGIVKNSIFVKFVDGEIFLLNDCMLIDHDIAWIVCGECVSE